MPFLGERFMMVKTNFELLMPEALSTWGEGGGPALGGGFFSMEGMHQGAACLGQEVDGGICPNYRSPKHSLARGTADRTAT